MLTRSFQWAGGHTVSHLCRMLGLVMDCYQVAAGRHGGGRSKVVLVDTIFMLLICPIRCVLVARAVGRFDVAGE